MNIFKKTLFSIFLLLVLLESGWSTWTEVEEITKANGFGYSVAIDGETIVVGYPFWNSQGQATIYQRNASGWFQRPGI